MMSVLERTGEIGTSMALGTRRKAVLQLFLTEGALLGVLGARETALWFAGTDNGSFVAALITLAIVSIFIALGMKTYARIQKVSFYGGMLGLLIVLVLLLTGSPQGFREGFETNAVEMFGAQPGVYEATA